MAISEEDYLTVQNQLALLAGLLPGLDLEGFVAAAEKAEGVGPLLDPTLWMRGHTRLTAIKELAWEALRFKHAAVRFREKMLEIEKKDPSRSPVTP